MLILCTFSLDVDDEYTTICVNDQKRAYFANHLPIDLIQPIYSAMRRLYDIIYEGHIQYKLQEGHY